MDRIVELTQSRRGRLRLLSKLAQLILKQSTILKLSLHEGLKARVKFAKVFCQVHIQQLAVVFRSVRLQIQRVFNAFSATLLVSLLAVGLVQSKRNARLARLLNGHKLVYPIQRSLFKNLQLVLHVHYTFFHEDERLHDCVYNLVNYVLFLSLVKSQTALKIVRGDQGQYLFERVRNWHGRLRTFPILEWTLVDSLLGPICRNVVVFELSLQEVFDSLVQLEKTWSYGQLFWRVWFSHFKLLVLVKFFHLAQTWVRNILKIFKRILTGKWFIFSLKVTQVV